MKYIYDILMNLDDKLYEFYEWAMDDEIEYFKKIPLFKVNNITYNTIVVNAIINDQSFINSIYNITEIYDCKRVKLVNYACLFTNGREVLGVLLNKVGKVLMISKLYIDEEVEVLDVAQGMSETKINVINGTVAEEKNMFLTRNETHKKQFLIKELEELYINKKIDKLKYLYYECFSSIEYNIDIVYERIKQFLNMEWDKKHDDLYDLVRLSYSKK